MEEIKCPDKEWWEKVEEEKPFPPDMLNWITTLTAPSQMDPVEEEPWELMKEKAVVVKMIDTKGKREYQPLFSRFRKKWGCSRNHRMNLKEGT